MHNFHMCFGISNISPLFALIGPWCGISMPPTVTSVSSVLMLHMYIKAPPRSDTVISTDITTTITAATNCLGNKVPYFGV